MPCTNYEGKPLRTNCRGKQRNKAVSRSQAQHRRRKNREADRNKRAADRGPLQRGARMKHSWSTQLVCRICFPVLWRVPLDSDRVTQTRANTYCTIAAAARVKNGNQSSHEAFQWDSHVCELWYRGCERHLCVDVRAPNGCSQGEPFSLEPVVLRKHSSFLFRAFESYLHGWTW